MNHRLLLFLLTLSFILTFSACVQAQSDKGFTQPSNRWALIVDIPRVSVEKSLDHAQSVEDFRKNLVQSGFDAEHVLVFSSTNQNKDWQPTTQNINRLLEGIKQPDLATWLKAGTADAARIRQNDGAAELLVFVLAEGFASKDQSKAVILPQNVDPASLSKGLDAPEVISIAELEETLINSEIERTMLLINFQTTENVRSATKQNRNLAAPNLKSITRSANSRQRTDLDTSNYLHIEICTKNQSMTEKASFSFYRMIQDGLQGSADIAGNQDGIVQATELAEYIKANARGFASVETAQNGNGAFALAKAAKSVNIPDNLFRDISNAPVFKSTSTGKNAQEREQKNRERKTQNQ